MRNSLHYFGWLASFAVMTLNVSSAALAQTASFVAVTDALPGRCYDAATTQPDPVNPNQLNIGIHSGINEQTFQAAACVASNTGPTLTMDTLSFLVSAPSGFYIAKIRFTQSGGTRGARGGAGYRGASWVVDDDPMIIPRTLTGWATTVDFTGQNKTVIPVAITTFLSAGGGRARGGSAHAHNPIVTVELAPLEEPSLEEPPVEEPSLEEPSLEEPSLEEPLLEEPPVEEPSLEEPPLDIGGTH